MGGGRCSDFPRETLQSSEPHHPCTNHLRVLDTPWTGPYRGGGGPWALGPVSAACITLAGGTALRFAFLCSLFCGHKKNGRNQKSVKAKG